MKIICKHCRLPVHFNAGRWAHMRNQFSPPSCGKLLEIEDVVRSGGATFSQSRPALASRKPNS